MSSNVHNAGSKLIRGEGVRSAQGNPPRSRRWRPGGGKLSVDSNCMGLRGPDRMLRQWAVVSG